MPVDKKFRKKIREQLNNRPLRKALGQFAEQYPTARENAYRGIDFPALRQSIKEIKTDAVEHIKLLTTQFESAVKERGGHVHHAADGRAVAEIIRDIAKKRGAHLLVKSKSMATEEIHLNQQLEDLLKVVETDLGEWIIQQIGETPSHMVMPAIHLTRETCAEIFSRHLGEPVPPDIPRMVELAREILRKEFLAADIGITGCNIAVAETGTMVLFTNEGNARLTTTLPPVHVVVAGYEKLVRRFRDIGPLAAAIPRSATCQFLTSYVTMISGPSQTFENKQNNDTGEKELHVILLDNGRLELLADPVFKQVGTCIRCASCLNVCPVYTMVGGQVYGDVYSGGIGALLTAFLHSYRQADTLQELCLNCGKCRESCPGGLDIPALLLELRGRIRTEIPPPFIFKTIIENILSRKDRMNLLQKLTAPGMRLIPGLPSPARKRLAGGEEKKFPPPEGTPQPGAGNRAAFFYGCMIDYLYPETGEAVIALLNRAGLHVELPRQGCCGAPALYLGQEKNAAQMLEKNLETLAGKDYDYIVTACPTGTTLFTKHAAAWGKDKGKTAERTIDFIKLVHHLIKEEKLNPAAGPGVGEIKITYHYSCHLRRESGIAGEPREVLEAVPGVSWVEMEEADRCCGFAGSYSQKLPEISRQLLNRKVEHILRSGADAVVTGCPGCVYWLRKGLKEAGSSLPVFHSAVFLHHALAGGLKKS